MIRALRLLSALICVPFHCNFYPGVSGRTSLVICTRPMGIKLFLSLFLFVLKAQAGLISIPLNDKDYKFAPASDLVFEGRRINEVEAIELEKKGIDLSTFDPYASDLFHPGEVLPEMRRSPVPEVTFHSFLQSPTEFFRFVSKTQNQSFTVTASLFNHETIVRSDLLRKIGFNIPYVSYQQVTKVSFGSVTELEMFSEKLIESTLLGKKKWIVEENKTEKYLKVRGLIFEPSDSRSVPVYWPVMEETRQRKRRVFRSLLYLYTLTDFNMPVNEISWNLGKIFNNELILSHHFSDDFSSVTISDLRWIHRKIIAIPEKKLCSGFPEAGYPDDIAELLCEKLKSRINTFGKALRLNSPYSVNERVSRGQVHSGKLISGNYPEFVPVFWIEDAENPYRFSEVFKYFRTQVSYDTVSSLLNNAEKALIPGNTTNEAFEDIVDKIRTYKKQNGTVPVKVWSAPTGGIAVGGSRSIVFGKYDGNDAPIQLVDSLNMKMQIGMFSYLSVPGMITPTGMINAQIVRSWKHIKSMPDLSTASKQQVEKLIIPRLYRSLGNVLNNDIKCSLLDEAWVSEEIVAGIGVWVVYYDQKNETAKQSALKLREELIGKGILKNKILLRSVLKDEICTKEIIAKRNKNIEEFLKSFAQDETLTVTDSLETSAGLGAKISDGIVDNLKFQGGIESGRAALRSYIIRKTDTGIEITVRNQRNLATRFFQEAKFIVDLISNSTNWLKGDLHEKVYRVNFDGIDDEQKKIAIEVLREIFLRSSYGLLTENYNPISMDHDARVRLNTFRFLWRKSERLKMNHEIKVVVPQRETQREIPQDETVDEWTVPSQPSPELSEAERTKTLFSTMLMTRKGSNYHVFLDRIINDQLSWLSTGAQDGDPGQSMKGSSTHEYITTEGDLTPGTEFNPVTKVEYGNIGWSITPVKLEKKLRVHENYLSTTSEALILDRSVFNQTVFFRSYNIRSTLILYPAATQKLLQVLLEADEMVSLTLLKTWYGPKEWDRYCRSDNTSFYESTKDRDLSYCVPHPLLEILDMRKSGIAKRKQDLGIQINKVVQVLMKNVQRAKLLSWIGKENYFGNTFISGFRNGDAVGYTQYASDSVGTYNKDLATGIFDQIAGLLGVKSYDLKGMVYTPNM